MLEARATTGVVGRRAGLGAWSTQRIALAAVVGALLLSAAWLGQIAPLLAQDGVGIAFDDLSSSPTHTTVDRFYVKVTGLSASATYEVVVWSDRAATLGIGGCGTATQTRSVTGGTTQDLRFVVYACTLGVGTLTAEVRAVGAATAPATVSQALTVLAIPEGAPAGVRGARAASAATRGATRAGTPGIVPNVRFDSITSNSARANWGKPSDGDYPLTGFGLLLWTGPDHPDYGDAFVAGKASRNHVYTGLQAATTYKFRIHACNGDDRCGHWTHPPVEFTTPPTPTPTPTSKPQRPDPTAPPEQPDPPKPPPIQRPGSAIANQMYLVGRPVSLLLPAASGGGHWTYTLSPALSNGLTFDPSSRTIAGTPQQGANASEHTYTATKTENGATTIETSKFAVAVFNLDVWAHRVDKDYARRLQGSTFWGGVLEHWSVLEYALMSIGDVLPSGVSRAGSYWFQLRLPASAGFQTNLTGGCTWPAAGPRDTTQLKTAWTPANWGFYFVRCSLGSASSANVELWVRDADGTEALLQPRPLSGQAWHDADHVTSFYVRGTAADQSIKLVESSFGAGDGLFSNLRPLNLGSTYTPNAFLGSLRHYSSAGGAWTGTGATVEAATSHGRADVVIEGYWDPDPPDGNDGKCGTSIACMEFSGPYPHLERGRRLFIEVPPHWGHGTNRLRTWVVNYEEYEENPQRNQYLPAVLVHEFGHAIGLGHSNDGSDIMNGGVRRIGCSGTSCGLTTNDREGARALYTSTHHAPH